MCYSQGREVIELHALHKICMRMTRNVLACPPAKAISQGGQIESDSLVP